MNNGMIPSELHTDRLLLRPFRETDADALFACCRNPKLGGNAGWKPHETPEESSEILHRIFLGQPGVWAVTERGNERLIGSAGIVGDLKRENDRARMLGYWLDEACWGRGLMTEAVRAVLRYGFETMALELVSAYCYPDNLRSRRVLEKCGFRYEGTLHGAERTPDGRVRDHLCYLLPNNL